MGNVLVMEEERLTIDEATVGYHQPLAPTTPWINFPFGEIHFFTDHRY